MTQWCKRNPRVKLQKFFNRIQAATSSFSTPEKLFLSLSACWQDSLHPEEKLREPDLQYLISRGVANLQREYPAEVGKKNLGRIDFFIKQESENASVELKIIRCLHSKKQLPIIEDIFRCAKLFTSQQSQVSFR